MKRITTVQIPYNGNEVFFSSNMVRLIVNDSVIDVRSLILHTVMDVMRDNLPLVPNQDEAYPLWLSERQMYNMLINVGRFEPLHILRSVRFILHEMKRSYEVCVDQTDITRPIQIISTDFGTFHSKDAALLASIPVHLAQSAITQMIGACRTLLLNSITHEIQNAGLYDIRTPQVA